MKKSDLKTGMTVELKDGSRAKVLLGTESGDVLGGTTEDTKKTWMSLDHFDEFLKSKRSNHIVKVYGITTNDVAASILIVGELLWERTPEKTYNIDGVEYSESTLKSLIKKATE